MTIRLITEREHSRLLKILEQNPALKTKKPPTGYDCLCPERQTEDSQAAIKEVSDILTKVITGFVEFYHFGEGSAGRTNVLFAYDWNADLDTGHGRSFVGPGFITIDELRYGFDKDKNPINC